MTYVIIVNSFTESKGYLTFYLDYTPKVHWLFMQMDTAESVVRWRCPRCS
jgi:hypothetical protein